ncbi:MAG: lactate utilization protein, partial [Candidatus Nealsonbacteria bacterium]|nr:lactate utilization protein [Candidatus Nealsonbacteria bacterium]
MPEDLHLEGAPFLKEQNAGLYEPAGSKSTGAAAERSTKHNRSITDAIPYWQDWRGQAQAVKAYAVANLDKLLVEFEQKISARGATVLWAETAEEANQHVLDIAREHNVKTVVKGKSMVSEEMELNHTFAAAGIQALETDLGEYIVQLAG